MKELSQNDGLNLHIAPDQTVDHAQLLSLVDEVHLHLLRGVEPDERALLPILGHLEHETPPVHERGDLFDFHAPRPVRVEAAEDLAVRVGHFSELFEALREFGPLEGLLQTHDNLRDLNVDDSRHPLDGDGGHVAEELSNLLVGMKYEQDGADGCEGIFYAEIRFLLHFESPEE